MKLKSESELVLSNLRDILGTATIHGQTHRIEGFFIQIKAVHEENPAAEVEIFQASADRDIKKNKKAELIALPKSNPAMLLLERLHISSATRNNGRVDNAPNPFQRYFQLAAHFFVRVNGALHLVNQLLSPLLIVRGGNPGRFDLRNPTGMAVRASDSESDPSSENLSDNIRPHKSKFDVHKSTAETSSAEHSKRHGMTKADAKSGGLAAIKSAEGRLSDLKRHLLDYDWTAPRREQVSGWCKMLSFEYRRRSD